MNESIIMQHGDVTADYLHALKADDIGLTSHQHDWTIYKTYRPVRRRTGRGLASKNERRARKQNANRPPARYRFIVNGSMLPFNPYIRDPNEV